jgi:hypothetical protein
MLYSEKQIAEMMQQIKSFWDNPRIMIHLDAADLSVFSGIGNTLAIIDPLDPEYRFLFIAAEDVITAGLSVGAFMALCGSAFAVYMLDFWVKTPLAIFLADFADDTAEGMIGSIRYSSDNQVFFPNSWQRQNLIEITLLDCLNLAGAGDLFFVPQFLAEIQKPEWQPPE